MRLTGGELVEKVLLLFGLIRFEFRACVEEQTTPLRA